MSDHGAQTNGAERLRRCFDGMHCRQVFGEGGCVRQNRVVLAPVAGVKSAEVLRAQPGWIAANSLATVTRRIRRRGERGISRKAIAQGMSDCLRCPVCSCAHLFVHICTRDRGCSAHPAFPAPSFWANVLSNLGRSCRGNASAYHLGCLKCELQVIARSESDQRNPYSFWPETPA